MIETPELLALAATVAGVSQVAKQTGLPNRWAGVFALLLGVGISLLADGVTRSTFLTGLAIGLAAQGLYETVTLKQDHRP